MNDITEKEFSAYEKLRVSGTHNMYLNHEIEKLTGLWHKTVASIKEQYDDLAKKYPEVIEKWSK